MPLKLGMSNLGSMILPLEVVRNISLLYNMSQGFLLWPVSLSETLFCYPRYFNAFIQTYERVACLCLRARVTNQSRLWLPNHHISRNLSCWFDCSQALGHQLTIYSPRAHWSISCLHISSIQCHQNSRLRGQSASSRNPRTTRTVMKAARRVPLHLRKRKLRARVRVWRGPSRRKVNPRPLDRLSAR